MAAQQLNPGEDSRTAVPALLMSHAFAALASFVLAHLVRFDLAMPPDRLMDMALWAAPAMSLKLICLFGAGAYRISWRYLDLGDMARLWLACAVATAFLALADMMIVPKYNIPRWVLAMDGVFTALLVTGSYLVPLYLHERRRSGAARAREAPAVIVGAGDAGDLLIREFQRSGRTGLRIVRFLDDHRSKIGLRIHGIPVDGPISEAALRAADEKITRAIIAIPSASPKRLREVTEHLLKAGFAIQTLPPVDVLSGTNISLIGQLKQLDVEDLLRRDPVRRESVTVSRTFFNETLLVTGAAGSIGSELCRQLMKFEPRKLVAVDRAETPLVDLQRELESKFPKARLFFTLADVNDEARMRGILADHRPQYVFHAAAVKHVPVAECDPIEAVRVNTLGTRLMADLCKEAGVGRFVLISTDKAVRPANIMGATKRLAEMVVQSRGGVAVRFGNVLGSNGSVVNVFKEQIARGGPVTVTHPDMQRYFMTIPEAVHLVLEAGTMGKGGEIFILDMGQPVKIVDLARDMIRLAGRKPDSEIQIEFTGIRPGEKIFEELSLDEEMVHETKHPQIVAAKAPPPSPSLIDGILGRLAPLVSEGATAHRFVTELKEVLPEYRADPATETASRAAIRPETGDGPLEKAPGPVPTL